MKVAILVGHTEKREPVEIEVRLERREVNGFVRLSISGSIWMISRRDIVAGGQMQDHIIEDVATYAAGWTRERLARIVEVWDRWHLNDMRAGCEHQRSGDFLKDADVTVTKHTWFLNTDTRKERDQIESDALAALREGKTITLDESARELLKFPQTVTTWDDERPSAASLYHENDYSKPEAKTLRWLSASEHPRGLLSKPCEVCGYKYGSAWLREELPADVLAEILALFPSDLVAHWNTGAVSL